LDDSLKNILPRPFLQRKGVHSFEEDKPPREEMFGLIIRNVFDFVDSVLTQNPEQ
tara:strand:+ start:12815 stop:12979 length:165 start_codon:yes stop_codon:yes gene_type:complete